MLRRTSGEGMQQDRSRDYRHGRKSRGRAPLRHGVLAIVCATALAGVCATAALAQTYGSDSGNAFDGIMRRIGLEQAPDPNADINYTERAPLVVPQSRELPRPGSDAAAPAPDWPKDATNRPKTKKKGEVVLGTAVQTPNPQIVKKPWYDPTGWFDKEEYANFPGEPVRRNLTDPPAGYQIPSAEQPYGIGPDKKTGRTPTASDFNMGAAAPPPAGQPAQ